jgi:hypothetical protein
VGLHSTQTGSEHKRETENAMLIRPFIENDLGCLSVNGQVCLAPADAKEQHVISKWKLRQPGRETSPALEQLLRERYHNREHYHDHDQHQHHGPPATGRQQRHGRHNHHSGGGGGGGPPKWALIAAAAVVAPPVGGICTI